MIVDRQKILPPIATTTLFYGSCVEVDGMQAIVGADGSAFILARSGGGWIEETTLPNSSQNFGSAVAIHGSIAVVAGTESTDGLSFRVAYVFEKQNGVWAESARLTARDATAGQLFGASLSVSGETIVVGAPGTGQTTAIVGSAYVFTRQASGWEEEQKLTASNGFAANNFGGAVSVSGDRIAIGARFDAEEGALAGAAYVYSRVGSLWSQDAKLLGGAPGIEFGNAISLSAETVVVGAIFDSRAGQAAGSAHVFVKEGPDWPIQQVLTPNAQNNSELDQKFGLAVSVDGDGIAVSSSVTVGGDPLKDLATYWFTRDEVNWTFQDRKTAGSKFLAGPTDDIVSISGCTIFQGAMKDQQAAPNAGAAHAYLLSKGCPCTERPPGMIAWWTMNQPSSPALDVVNGNDATWVGDVAPFQGMVKGGLLFNGQAHLEVAHHPTLNLAKGSDFTIDMWVKPVKQFKPRETLIAKGMFPAGALGYSLHLLNGHLGIELGDGVNTLTFDAQDPLPLDQWAFLAVTIEPADKVAIIYVNGIKIAGVSLGPTPIGAFNTDQPLLLGGGSDPDDRFIGIIDEVEIFDRALGADELFKIYAALTGGKCPPCTPPPSEMVSWWTFDDLSGGVAIDRIGGNDGTLNGQPADAPGKVGNAISFSTADQHVVVAHDQSLEFGTNRGLTIDCWLRLDPPSQGIGVLVEKWDAASRVGFRLFHRSRRLIFAYSDGTSSQFGFIADFELPLSDWTFVAVTVDPVLNEGKVYMDDAPLPIGEFLPNSLAPAGISNAADLLIGGNKSGENLSGRIDELEIFERALSHTQLLEIYNAGDQGKCRVLPDSQAASKKTAYGSGVTV